MKFGEKLLTAIAKGTNEQAKQAAQVNKDNLAWRKWIAANPDVKRMETK